MEDLFACKAKVCNKRHPKVCKRFTHEKFFKFWSNCAYLHLIDSSVKVQKQLDGFDLKRSSNELQIKMLEDEVKTLKSHIDQLATLYTDLSDKFDKVTQNKHKAKQVIGQIGENKDKFKCNVCEFTFKKEITLRKHQSTKHYNVSHAKNQ